MEILRKYAWCGNEENSLILFEKIKNDEEKKKLKHLNMVWDFYVRILIFFLIIHICLDQHCLHRQRCGCEIFLP